jgi:hypothetical protein
MTLLLVTEPRQENSSQEVNRYRGPESKSCCRRSFEDRGPIRRQTRHTRVAYRRLA